MKRIYFGVLFLCLTVFFANTLVFAEEQERTLYFYEGMFPPTFEEERVSLFAISDKEAIKEEIKAEIKAALLAKNSSLNVEKYKIPEEDSNKIGSYYYEVLYENPGLFYAKTKIKVWGNGEIITKLDFSESYAYTDDATIKQNQKWIDAEVDQIINGISLRMSDAEKALYVHDWFALHYAYDVPASLTGEATKAHRIDGLFIDKSAVCQGYALGYIYVMDKLGIKTEYVQSQSMNHAWNLIEIDEKWYHTDVTWGDPTVGKTGDIIGYVTHDNFLRSDEGIRSTGHDGWTETQHVVDSRDYDGFWKLGEDKYVYGGMFYHNGMWYYMADDDIVSYNPANPLSVNNPAKLKEDVQSAWGTGDGIDNMAVGINMAIYNDYIYYNTCEEIRCMHLDGTEDHIYFDPQKGDAKLFGLRIDADILCYGYTENPDVSIQFEEIELDWFSAVSGADGLKINLYNAPDAPETGQFYVAMYKANELLHFNTVTLTEEKEYKFELPENVADRVCVYAWNGFTPIGRIKTILLNQEV